MNTNFFTANLDTIAWFVYLLASILFIQGLRYMNSPKTARKGNFVSITGMIVASVMACINSAATGFNSGLALAVLAAGIIIGAVIGVISAKRVHMTAMPQLVSLFNTVGGGAAALVAINDALSPVKDGSMGHTVPGLISAVLGIAIGCITFSGSLIAAGKLQGIVSGSAVRIPLKRVIDIVSIAGIVFFAYMVVAGQSFGYPVWLPVVMICVFALIIGLTFALPIGGADMPVVISVLNACTGTAVAMAGFVINNLVMIVAGALVGAAGAILSLLMAKAMNRSLLSVLGGGFGDTSGATDDAGPAGDAAPLRETSADDLAVQLAYANSVIIVPGYGLAVAGAQHEIADLTKLLEGKGVDVKFAIHPVAGRMPGHMNVLLAEANIPYEKLLDMDDINPLFPTADVALVVGANDVTNPAARRQGTPISGMPILDVDAAKAAVVVKRGRGKGYAGIENELYGLPGTSMLYGDAKKVVADVIAAVKEL
ncbi:MAG: NAD(P)(+) transhydrogenase (Re/Si-specific) subunit beta [Lactobacillaceae bacterium]|jgi:NAD(P) transhydrogenase subunit beta|nr:NAD(P)(+) transhydrogenase (Re/Si-specific) subunit beta [Lactobacillaceae bacterium]